MFSSSNRRLNISPVVHVNKDMINLPQWGGSDTKKASKQGRKPCRGSTKWTWDDFGDCGSSSSSSSPGAVQSLSCLSLKLNFTWDWVGEEWNGVDVMQNSWFCYPSLRAHALCNHIHLQRLWRRLQLLSIYNFSSFSPTGPKERWLADPSLSVSSDWVSYNVYLSQLSQISPEVSNLGNSSGPFQSWQRDSPISVAFDSLSGDAAPFFALSVL